MGQKEFYNPLKNSVDKIEDATNTINTNVKEIKNTDLSKINDKIGTSANTNTLFQAVQGMITGTRWEEFNKFKSKQVLFTAINTTTYTSVFKITGAGYIEEALFTAEADANGYAGIQLLLDGNVFVYLENTSANTTKYAEFGAFQESSNLKEDTHYSNVSTLTDVALPNTTKQTAPSIQLHNFLSRPIFFDTSLEVLAKGWRYKVDFRGGFK